MNIWLTWQRLGQMSQRNLTQRMCFKCLREKFEIRLTWQRDRKGLRHLSRSESEPGRCEPAFGNTETKIILNVLLKYHQHCEPAFGNTETKNDLKCFIVGWGWGEE